MIAGSASLKAVSAALRSPLAIASSTRRTEPRRAERRDLLTSVRRAIWRVALRADLVLAMSYSFIGACSGKPAQICRICKEKEGGESFAATARLIGKAAAGVNAAKQRLSDAFCPNRIVAR